MRNRVLDDISHAGVGAAAVGIAIIFPGAHGGIIAGLIIGFLAELKEKNPYVIKVPLDRVSWRDVLGYTLGGAVAGLLL